MLPLVACGWPEQHASSVTVPKLDQVSAAYRSDSQDQHANRLRRAVTDLQEVTRQVVTHVAQLQDIVHQEQAVLRELQEHGDHGAPDADEHLAARSPCQPGHSQDLSALSAQYRTRLTSLHARFNGTAAHLEAVFTEAEQRLTILEEVVLAPEKARLASVSSANQMHSGAEPRALRAYRLAVERARAELHTLRLMEAAVIRAADAHLTLLREALGRLAADSCPP